MNIEQDIFKKTIIDYNLLLEYGFTKEHNLYKYSKPIMDTFRVDITIDDKQTVRGSIYDLSIEEEYISFRINNNEGTFVGKVRGMYIEILNDIKEKCTKTKTFITKQANRITDRVINMYNDKPEFLWDSSPGTAVFRNKVTKKWYALIANIDKSKIEENTSGEIEVINLKLDSNKIRELLKRVGFYKAYHMNKKNWISIILDDTITDEEIITYIEESYSYTKK